MSNILFVLPKFCTAIILHTTIYIHTENQCVNCALKVLYQKLNWSWLLLWQTTKDCTAVCIHTGGIPHNNSSIIYLKSFLGDIQLLTSCSTFLHINPISCFWLLHNKQHKIWDQEADQWDVVHFPAAFAHLPQCSPIVMHKAALAVHAYGTLAVGTLPHAQTITETQDGMKTTQYGLLFIWAWMPNVCALCWVTINSFAGKLYLSFFFAL